MINKITDVLIFCAVANHGSQAMEGLMDANLKESQMSKLSTLIVLFIACGANQNDPLIDYLQGLRKALMELILNPLHLKCLFGATRRRTQLFYKTGELSLPVCRNGPAQPRRLLDGIMGRQWGRAAPRRGEGNG